MTETTITKTTQVNLAVATASSLPDLVAKLSTIDPGLANALQSKALVASKSVYGPFLATMAAYASTKYGFGWDDTTDQLISGVVLLAASAICRLLTQSPIGGVFTKGNFSNPVISAPPK